MKINKKRLVARVYGVGLDRILFNKERLNEIKEAITKQDIRDLVADGAIVIKEPKGRKTIVRRTQRRRAGSVKKKVGDKKQKYVKFIRRMRASLRTLANQQKLDKAEVETIRRELRARRIHTHAQLKERVATRKTE